MAKVDNSISPEELEKRKRKAKDKAAMLFPEASGIALAANALLQERANEDKISRESEIEEAKQREFSNQRLRAQQQLEAAQEAQRKLDMEFFGDDKA